MSLFTSQDQNPASRELSCNYWGKKSSMELYCSSSIQLYTYRQWIAFSIPPPPSISKMRYFNRITNGEMWPRHIKAGMSNLWSQNHMGLRVLFFCAQRPFDYNCWNLIAVSYHFVMRAFHNFFFFKLQKFQICPYCLLIPFAICFISLISPPPPILSFFHSWTETPHQYQI